ncbi:MAG: hypothetical protein GTO45_04700 [Candidatus Aminicenantes bacterium]|nr:hypothetical protein [Candidatus Aminicenantes bacterium]NIM78053.1 hypothetical protein [Candidatus Aminicenantes bacterium]NIN17370.1 hypothetical protein [Candidatus Aminicenantes bacterium]NIN41263.1 hypothetical protein [Candidatus Aminicenantes bacterium]NIN84036.1 hypothetical protein [Candidatus Aminicenantes bacterium]
MTVAATHLANDILEAIAGRWGYLDAAAKLAGHPERLALFLTGREQEITPVNIEIWPSLRCNARCPKCPYRTNGARHEADRRNASKRLISLQTLVETGLGTQDVMPIERWAKMAHEFRQAGGLSVTFTSGGEPTEHPNLPDFGRIARQEGLAWGLYSNGCNLTADLVNQLLANSPEFIRVSINSWSAHSHD